MCKCKVLSVKRRAYIWIAAAGLAAYAKALSFGFTYLDDNALILNNFNFLKNPSNIFTAFRQDVFHTLHGPAAYYRPMLTASFILDAQLGGRNPFIYHLTNIIIHLTVSCLVFLLLAKLGYGRTLSFFFSLIFAVHPVLSQAVAWIPGRNDSLMALFALASFIFFVKFLEETGLLRQPTGKHELPRNDKSTAFYLVHMLFLALALFTKETAVVLAPLCAGYGLWVTGYIPRTPKPVSRLFAGWLAVCGLWFFLRHAALAGSNPIQMTGIDMARSLAINAPALIQFVGKILFPFNLSVLPLMPDTGFGYGIAAIILITAALFFARRAMDRGLALFGAAWFILFLAPSFIRPNPAIPADFIEHRVYMPIVGFFIVMLEAAKGARDAGYGKRGTGYGVRGAMCVIIGLLATITFFHIDNFKDRTAFWANAVKNSPHSALAHRNLGAMRYLDNRLDEAEAGYKKALELNRLEPMAHNNLGLIYARRGGLKKAEEEYREELAINPYYDDAHYNYGLLCWREGRFREARDLWKRALEINPDHVDARRALGAEVR